MEKETKELLEKIKQICKGSICYDCKAGTKKGKCRIIAVLEKTIRGKHYEN